MLKRLFKKLELNIATVICTDIISESKGLNKYKSSLSTEEFKCINSAIDDILGGQLSTARLYKKVQVSYFDEYKFKNKIPVLNNLSNKVNKLHLIY